MPIPSYNTGRTHDARCSTLERFLRSAAAPDCVFRGPNLYCSRPFSPCFSFCVSLALMHSPQLVQLSKVAVLRGSISTGQLVTLKLLLAQASPREASYSMCSVSRVLNRNCHMR